MRRRRNLTATERSDLWARWKGGQSLSDIARALDRKPGTIHRFLSASGGIAPAARCRSSRALSSAEREEISRGLSAGLSARQIAVQLGRQPSTICREIGRNGGRSKYRASVADLQAWRRARRPKACKLACNRRLQRAVAAKLQLQSSPEQIAGWLRQSFPTDKCMRVSHETIYRSLFIQARGVLKKELMSHLRSTRRMRRSKLASIAGQAAWADRGRGVDSRAPS